MVGRTRRGKRKHKLLSNHQRSWIWGRNTVVETLRYGIWPVIELIISNTLDDELAEFCTNRASELGIKVDYQLPQDLTKRCRSAEHQGLLALMGEFPYSNEEQVLQSLTDHSLIILLDSIQDPFNFGAMLRTFAALGVDAVFLRDRNQVGVTSQVARSSVGAVNLLPIVRVADFKQLIKRLQAANLRCYAATEKSTIVYTACDFRAATAIVIGNEGRGVDEQILQTCDKEITIPLIGKIGSLNAAVAAGILVSEVQRQRNAQK